MRQVLLAAAVAFTGFTFAPAPSMAQGISIDLGGPRVETREYRRDHDRDYRRGYREGRNSYRRDDCRTREVRTIRPNGDVVIRRIRDCD
jgi:hypothetical protein